MPKKGKPQKRLAREGGNTLKDELWTEIRRQAIRYQRKMRQISFREQYTPTRRPARRMMTGKMSKKTVGGAKRSAKRILES